MQTFPTYFSHIFLFQTTLKYRPYQTCCWHAWVIGRCNKSLIRFSVQKLFSAKVLDGSMRPGWKPASQQKTAMVTKVYKIFGERSSERETKSKSLTVSERNTEEQNVLAKFDLAENRELKEVCWENRLNLAVRKRYASVPAFVRATTPDCNEINLCNKATNYDSISL